MDIAIENRQEDLQTKKKRESTPNLQTPPLTPGGQLLQSVYGCVKKGIKIKIPGTQVSYSNKARQEEHHHDSLNKVKGTGHSVSRKRKLNTEWDISDKLRLKNKQQSLSLHDYFDSSANGKTVPTKKISQERTVSRPKKKRKHQQEYVTADQVDKEKKSDEKDPSTAPQGLSEYCISSLNISEAIQPETIDLTADSETVDLTAESESSSSTESESYSSRNQKVLFCYPFEGKERSKFLITKSEEMKLQEGEYLNDCLIDFGARRFCDLVSRTNPETIEDTHIFSCYFFSDLLDKADTDNSFCDLRKWTSKVDIFKKKYVIIPVNECHHWYLLIVCNINRCISNSYLDEDEDEDSIDYKEGTDEEAFNKPYIFVLDSLDEDRTENMKLLSDYLEYEALSKEETRKKLFLKPELIHSNVPLQKNGTDCGLYLLHFVEMFLMNPTKNIKLLKSSKCSKRRWNVAAIPYMRSRLLKILHSLRRRWHRHIALTLPEEEHSDNK